MHFGSKYVYVYDQSDEESVSDDSDHEEDHLLHNVGMAASHSMQAAPVLGASVHDAPTVQTMCFSSTGGSSLSQAQLAARSSGSASSTTETNSTRDSSETGGFISGMRSAIRGLFGRGRATPNGSYISYIV